VGDADAGVGGEGVDEGLEALHEVVEHLGGALSWLLVGVMVVGRGSGGWRWSDSSASLDVSHCLFELRKQVGLAQCLFELTE